MKLLFDIGNTRLKWALWDGTNLTQAGALAHAATIDFGALLAPLRAPDAVWIASVGAPALDDALTQALAARWPLTPNFVRSSAAACGVYNAYAQPERLGVDRFLNLIALHASDGGVGAHVIASCGTALTLDALAPGGRHLGGLIAPSPDLMRQALLGNTARLGALEDVPVVEIADSTAAAVASGSWLAAAALVERFRERAASQFGTRPDLVLSGGGADRLARLIAGPHRIEPDLVLRGLAHFADRAAHVG